LVSADTRWRFSDQTVLTAPVAGTSANMPFRDSLLGTTRHRHGTGIGYYGRIERRTRHSVTAVTTSGSSPDYRADLGFTRRVNTNVVSIQPPTTRSRSPTRAGFPGP
jgi:hypothetical protein